MTVPQQAKQMGEPHPGKWDWVERSVWTKRMLDALEKGVKGGKWYSLMDKIYKPQTLYLAWLEVKANKGSAGSDRQSIKSFEKNLSKNLNKLHEELRSGSYRPRPILRVYIDKPGSKDKRPLGIPSIRDRVVQAALVKVIEPIFEHEFTEHSYGFRPGRGCKDALREVAALHQAGYTHVVDADIKAYFDSIPHPGLLDDILRYISDGRVLELIEAFLKQAILEGTSQWTPESGSPQGAICSLLLSNLYLHAVDVAMAQAGYRMIRYADDVVIMCKSITEANAALDTLHQLLEERGLTLHPVKTKVVDTATIKQGFDFLGYHFEGNRRWPRRKSMNKLRDSIRQKTRRKDGRSMPGIIDDINLTLRGWFEYFKHSYKWTFEQIDKWARRRLRSILRRRNKLKGISVGGHDHQRWPNRFFQDLGLFSLKAAHASRVQSSRG